MNILTKILTFILRILLYQEYASNPYEILPERKQKDYCLPKINFSIFHSLYTYIHCLVKTHYITIHLCIANTSTFLVIFK